MEKKIPHNIEAEQAVLGSIFYDPNVINAIQDKLISEDFYFKRHQVIFQAMVDLSKENIDIDYATINDLLEKQGKIAEAGGIDYIMLLVNSVPSVTNVQSYVNIVKDNSVLRRIITKCTEIVEDSYGVNSVPEFVDHVEKEIFSVTKERRSSDFKSISQVTGDVRNMVEEAKINQGKITGIDTGFIDLNNFILGFQKTELLIIAARPSVGKTSFALNLALNAAKSKNKPSVAFFSLEMGNEQLVMRLLSTEANIDNFKLRNGNLSDKEWERLNYGLSSLDSLNIYFDDAGTVKINDVRSKCRKLKQEGKLDLLIIDYLQLLSGSEGSTNRVQEVSEISRGLKEIARELKIPVIALSQLSRSVESRTIKKPMMADLRESGSIEQDADIIMFLYRDEMYNAESTENNQITVIVAKNRSGRVGEFNLIFNKDRMTFGNISREFSDNDIPR